ncbi:hypothetical protein SpCBS45565_g03886 [Spizellomyces sp. 'palustris']|nr:hypothetical protein SpCBS45565_g03886 [Spizellomyces sp. 'palustris']
MPGTELPGLAETNIWLACSDGRIDLVEHFLKHGGPGGTPLDPNVKDDTGYTPLHAAAAYAHIPLIHLLVTTYHAQIDIVDDEGDTPLHVCETAAVAKCLVELGADVERRNGEGKLPIEAADEEERDDVVAYLKDLTPTYERAIRTLSMEEFAHMFENGADVSCDDDDDGSGDDVDDGDNDGAEQQDDHDDDGEPLSETAGSSTLPSTYGIPNGLTNGYHPSTDSD